MPPSAPSYRETTRQPGGAPVAGQPAGFDPVAEARMLLRTTRAGTLATLDEATGHPFASLVTVATDIDGAPLLLLSGLSAHTRNALADPRVSLLLGRGGRGDPLAHARLTVLGRLEAVSSEEEAARARRRFLARHPKASLYAGFPDFGLFRLAAEGGHLNGGFARAARLSADEMVPAVPDLAGFAAMEAGAVAHMNADHAGAVSLYAQALGRRAGRWRLTGIDPQGIDLALGEETARALFPAPLAGPQAIRGVLVEMARQAREAKAG